MMLLEYPFAINAIKLIAVMSRITAFVMAFPFFSANQISAKFKIGFILFISIILMPILPSGWSNAEFLKNLDMFKLLFLVLNEVILGLTIALLVMIMIGIFTFAGSITDRDMGFMMARLIDPAAGDQNTIMSHVLTQMFLILFLVMDGHHEILRIAAASFETLPPGSFMIDSNVVSMMIKISSLMFTTGLKIALPIFGVMLMVNVALGLMARVGQDFPVLMLSFPLRIGIGLVMMVSLFPIFMTIARTVQSQLFQWMAYFVNLEL